MNSRAQETGVSRNMVSKWRSRFLARRLEGLTDEPRPGWPRLITDDQVERVITKTLAETPGQDTYWSTRSMASAPPENALVLAVDERSQMQAIDRTPARMTHDCVRHGTTSLFAAFDISSGSVITHQRLTTRAASPVTR